MLRYLCPLLIAFALPTAQAASLNETELHTMLTKVAKESSVGTPRAINENILDRGYTVTGVELVNHLSVLPSHASQMRTNLATVRNQLGASVCANPGYRDLLSKGASLRYEFTEYQTNKPITTERFRKADCKIK